MIEKTLRAQQEKMKELGLDKKSRKIAKAKKLMGLGAQSEKEKKSKKKAQKNNNKQFTHEDKKKIAEQITLLAFDKFHAIKPREGLNQNWKKKDKELRAPNICENVKFFNNLSKYISMTILTEGSVKKRSKIIKKWIKIGVELAKLHNFESLAAIQGTLTSNPIHKLKNEWKCVPEKYQKKFKEFQAMYSRQKNHFALRKMMQITPPPMIPYTGIFLQDLFCIEESQKTNMKDGTVNFKKLMALQASIQRIQLLQNAQYNFIKANPKIQQFIKDGLNRYAPMTSDKIYHIAVSVASKSKK